MKKKMNPRLQSFIQTMDLLFTDQEPTVHKFSCQTCKKVHTMDLDLYKDIIQRSRLVVHCGCGNAVDVL